MPETILKKTSCTRDCPDACGLIATVTDGRVVRLQGDPDHPVTQGFICQRTSRFIDRQYSIDRLTRPLLRSGKSGSFQEVDWTSALDLVAERLLKYRSESGGASILQYRCGGSLGILKHIGDYFFEQFGPVTTKSGDVCAGAGEVAQETDFGTFDSSDYLDFHQSNTIFLWGKNVFVSSIHLIPELKKARANGARIVVIDPIRNQTASIADTYVQSRPGADSAIAMGIAAWLFEHGLTDPNAADYCDHVDDFRRLAESRSIDEWAAIADITSAELVMLAKGYSNGPTCSMIGWGLQRRRHGSATIRTIDALAAVSGNLGIAGGGASFYFVRRDAFDLSFANRNPSPRRIPEPLLASGILSASEPGIRMAYVWAANPVAMLPDSNQVQKALESREFTVVVDPFMTDTAKCADLVLPTTTMLEENDLVGAYGHHYLGLVNQVVDAPEGVLSDHDIYRELSKRVGLAHEFDVDTNVWIDRLLGRLGKSGTTVQLAEEGFAKNPFASPVLFADRQFKTDSGKVNLIHDLHEDLVTQPATAGLRLTAVSSGKSQGSQWPTNSQVGPAEAIVNPATVVGHNAGDVVSLKTAVGSMDVKLSFDATQRTDVVLMDKGGWHSARRSANALIEAELTDDGECAVYYDTPAEISATER